MTDTRAARLRLARPTLLLACLLAWAPAGAAQPTSAGPTGSEPPAAAPGAWPDETLAAAAERALPLIQSSMETWYERRSCFSCHHQGLGTMAVSLARERGVAVDEPAAERLLGRLLRHLPGGALQGNAGINATFGRGYELLALGAEDIGRDLRTEALASYLMGNAVARGPEGAQVAWLSDSFRPPLEASPVSATALALHGIARFHADGRAAQARDLLARGRAWLLEQQPEDAEQRAMRLLGLGWSGADPQQLAAAAEAILSEQRPDGGWAQLATSESDAYATGQALVALNQWGGLAPGSPAYQRGLAFLLSQQLDDGTWRVETRRRAPGLQYFETGFPHGSRQFLSAAASAWAVMALCCALQPGPSPVFHGPRSARRDDAFDDGFDPVQFAAAFGTLDELRQALDAGGDPNAPGPDGMRPLHLAVHDADKLALLLERGAALDATTERGATALLVAAWYGPDEAPALLLLEHGADVHVADTENGVTPLLRAAGSGKLRLIEGLLAAGADLDEATDDGGALHRATTTGDLPTVARLLELGAPVDARCDECTPLHWAAHDGEDRLVALLLAHGADPDAVDDDGMTALAWAAKVEHGHRRVLDALLAAGADVTIASSTGRTPLDWARQVDNELAIAALESLPDSR